MPTPIRQLLASTFYTVDASTIWNFSFAGGYIDKAHVRAYTETPAGIRTDLVITLGSFIGPYQLQITGLTVGNTLCIYRDTPKDNPLVNFTDESGFSEIALDTNARQAVFIGAESFDGNAGTSLALAAASAAAVSQAAAAVSAAAALVSRNNAEAAASAAAISAASISLPALVQTGAVDQTIAGIKTFTNSVSLDKAQNGATLAVVKNTDTGASATAGVQFHSGAGKLVNLYAQGAGNYCVLNGQGGIVVKYEDFDTQFWRSTAGTQRAKLDSSGYQVDSLGVGTAPNSTVGDATFSRAGGTTGYAFFGSSNAKYLGHDGPSFVFSVPGSYVSLLAPPATVFNCTASACAAQ